MVYIDGGAFVDDWDGPGVEHIIEPFLFDRLETTGSAYAECVADGGCSEPAEPISCYDGASGTGERPVSCIDWQQASEYCAWRGARLPTEWEWEWAGRGRDEARTYPWGDSPDVSCTHAVVAEWGTQQDSGCDLGSTWPVGSKPLGVSRDGLLDMAGNVKEWTSSHHQPPSTDYFTTKGGGYNTTTNFNTYFYVAERDYLWATNSLDDVGVRCAKDV